MSHKVDRVPPTGAPYEISAADWNRQIDKGGVSILEFGAVGDAVPLAAGSHPYNGTNNDAAFAAAIAYCVPLGLPIYVPPGNYRISATWSAAILALGANCKSFSMYGDRLGVVQPGTTSIYCAEVTGHLITPTDAWVNFPISIEGIYFDGSNGQGITGDQTMTSTTWTGLYDSSALTGAVIHYDLNIRRCGIINNKVANSTFLDCKGTFYVGVEDSYLGGMWADGTLLMRCGDTTHFVRRTQLREAAQCFDHGGGATFEDCVFESAFTVGNVHLTKVVLRSCHIENPGHHAGGTWSHGKSYRDPPVGAPSGQLTSWFTICRGDLEVDACTGLAPVDGWYPFGPTTGVFDFITANDPNTSLYHSASLRWLNVDFAFGDMGYWDANLFRSDNWDAWTRPYIEVEVVPQIAGAALFARPWLRNAHRISKGLLRVAAAWGGDGHVEIDWGRVTLQMDSVYDYNFAYLPPFWLPMQMGDRTRRSWGKTPIGNVNEAVCIDGADAALAVAIPAADGGGGTISFTVRTGEGALFQIGDTVFVSGYIQSSRFGTLSNVVGDVLTMNGAPVAYDCTAGSLVTKYKWLPDSGTQNAYRTRTTTPVGAVAPLYVGERLLDTVAKKWWTGTGTGTSDWQ